MIITKKHLSRRTFLRGTFGAAMALFAAIGLAGCKEETPAGQGSAAAAKAETFHWKMVTSWPKN